MATRCCPCNGARAKCLRCVCCKRGSRCVSCLTGDQGTCNNTAVASSPSSSNIVAPEVPPRGSDLSTSAAPDPSPSDHTDPPTVSLTSGIPSLSSVCRLAAPTLEHVPKKARDVWAGVLARTIDLVVASPTDLDAWTRLLILPKCIIYLPSPGHKCSTRNSVRAVKDRIKCWHNGDFILLWTEVVSAI